MDKKFKKLFIIDGSYLLHRNLHVKTIFDFTSERGVRCGGVYGFLRSLNSELRSCSDYFPVVCFDNGLSKRRTDLDNKYKKNDEHLDKSKSVLVDTDAKIDYVTQYREQMNILIEVLTMFGIPSIKLLGWEGDDLITIISQQCESSIVMTDDKDMLQLLNDSCRICQPMANKNKFKGSTITLDSFLEDNGFDSIYDFTLKKAILGDKSDSIPSSCMRIGEKSVSVLISIIKLFLNDLSMFPKTQDELKELCEEYGFKYKKDYLNFDIDRFKINLGLVDLALVKADNNVLDHITSVFTVCDNKRDFMGVLRKLNELSLKDVNADAIMSVRNRNFKNLFLEEKRDV